MEILALLDGSMGKNGILIMFICNHCPYVKKIADKIASITTELAEIEVNTLAIMSNDYRDYREDSPEKMIIFKEKYNFSFPYLLDEDQSVGKSFGAVCTPDFFGFNRNGELQYRGNIDELLEAMKLISKTGFGPKRQTPMYGLFN